MPKYRGRVDCYLNPSTGDGIPGGTATNQINSRVISEYFTNLVQHISSSGATALGIEMIAANFGVGGQGLDFWDSAASSGPRAWACFRFHSASLGKFDCLVFVATGSVSPGYALGGPAINGQTTTPASTTTSLPHTLGISFASHPSGSNVSQTDGPWNGTYSLTSASIGNPIWKVNSQGKGAFFPRNNGILGNFSGSRNWLTPLLAVDPDHNSDDPRITRLHVITSEDSLTVIHDRSDNSSHKIFHFGSFTPRSGTNCESPYFMYTPGTEGSSLTIPIWAEQIGYMGPAVSAGTVTNDGGIAHPNLLSGSRVILGNTMVYPPDNLLGYNIFVNSGSYELFPGWATIYERPDNYGILGVYNHIKMGWGMNNKSVSEASSSAAFGTNTLNDRKLVVPWQGVPPGVVGSPRTGRNFNIG